MLTEIEKHVIAAIQGDLPITETPYADIAGQLDLTEDQLLGILRDLVSRGIIRRFGATLRHQKSGYSANAMVAWQIDEERIEAIGTTLSEFRAVSHCYRRDPTATWPYNLYTMVHARNEDECRRIAAEMAQTVGVSTYHLLFSRRELKKTSMAYFDNHDAD